MGGNKMCLIIINGNINAQTCINDVVAVETLPFIQFYGPNVTFMHNNARPHSSAITSEFFLATNNVNVCDRPANSPNLSPTSEGHIKVKIQYQGYISKKKNWPLLGL